MVISHSKTLSSSTRPAEKPSTGFLRSSADRRRAGKRVSVGSTVHCYSRAALSEREERARQVARATHHDAASSAHALGSRGSPPERDPRSSHARLSCLVSWSAADEVAIVRAADRVEARERREWRSVKEGARGTTERSRAAMSCCEEKRARERQVDKGQERRGGDGAGRAPPRVVLLRDRSVR